MKGKIIRHFWGPVFHLTCLTKRTKYGTFYAECHAHEEDLDIANQWDGGMFAEYKCDLQAEQAKYKVLRERAKGIEHVCNILSRKYNPEYDACFADVLYQLKVAKDVAQEQKQKCKRMRENYSAFCEKTLNERRAFRKKHSQEENN